jgi:hypothetical protein
MNAANPNSPPVPEKQQAQGAHRHRASSRPMRIRRVSMQHGWYWFIEGFSLWLRHPPFLSFLTAGCALAFFAVQLVPYVGGLLCMMLYPSLTLGVFNGCRAIDRRRRLSPELLLSGFRRRAYDLLLAGFCNFVACTVALLGTIPIDDGALWRLFIYLEEPDAATLVSPRFLYAILMAMALLLPWGTAYLFVPQIIGWWHLSAPKALSSSFSGCLRNLIPFFAYIFCYLFFVCMLSALVINFFSLTREGLGTLACAVFILVMVPVLMASVYVAARDIFGLPRRRRHRRRPEQAQKPQEAEKATSASE